MPESLPEIDKILHSGQLSYSKWGKEFETKLGQYIGNNNILTVNSYNSAALVALTTIGVKPGDEIIASPMSCLASNQPIATLNAKVVWADIDPKTGTLDPESVKKRVTTKTKAILHNHFCGYLGYIDEINKIGKELGIVIIDDCIEAFGSEYKGKKTGNLATDISLFSFQTVRLPNTIDGGAISFSNRDLYEKAKLVRDYGIDRTKFRDANNEISNQCDIAIPGYGATLSEINSYIGCIQLNKTQELLKVQQDNAKNWELKLKKNDPELNFIASRNEVSPNYWVFGILSQQKDKHLLSFRENGYYTSGVHLNNNHYSVFGRFEELKGVSEFYSKFLALPCGWWFNL
jgi:dTDP-4-amino-4,6-dideoxygalactose transaminase